MFGKLLVFVSELLRIDNARTRFSSASFVMPLKSCLGCQPWSVTFGSISLVLGRFFLFPPVRDQAITIFDQG